ncbi:TIGR03862 family flavoprotein [Paracoccus suum]|uniref:TIGR03862 family flavoprotein n=2 Tax=Paracoccus suum TaxID=2259340 RepID=A0A344PNW5_9RHOB|nr:TIGR03862 family flavoprotein [Paracoccus suum]AXC51070.1 TIGR03862 family flavoprotein [Paracoccus suum]
MAAETLAGAGHPVVIADAMPSPARKFLMAGKSGLNLTKAEDPAAFAARITGSAAPHVQAALMDFGPDQVAEWAEGLGITLFRGSTGRVFPVGMKASPLLRAWLARLESRGAVLRRRWRWTGWLDGGARFETPEGPRVISAGVTVLALGGASWPRLGSDGAWINVLAGAAVPITPLAPANMGFRVDWHPAMARQFGQPVKGTALRAGTLASRGEWVITPAGIEGGAIYEIAAALRAGAGGTVDLAPDVDTGALAARFGKSRGSLSLGNWLRRCLGDPVKVALLLEWGGPAPTASPADWAARAKALPLRHAGPLGLARAISSAGGIAGHGLGPGFALTALRGTYAAGEMLDWEAPTGGYLLSACLATGRAAGLAAAAELARA